MRLGACPRQASASAPSKGSRDATSVGPAATRHLGHGLEAREPAGSGVAAHSAARPGTQTPSSGGRGGRAGSPEPDRASRKKKSGARHFRGGAGRRPAPGSVPGGPFRISLSVRPSVRPRQVRWGPRRPRRRARGASGTGREPCFPGRRGHPLPRPPGATEVPPSSGPQFPFLLHARTWGSCVGWGAARGRDASTPAPWDGWPRWLRFPCATPAA